MKDKTAGEPLHDNLRDLIGQAISDEIAAGAEQPDWCDSREIDRLADAVLAVLPKRRTTLSPELRAALDEAAKTGATVAEVPGGGLVFINRGEQLEDGPDLNCPACGGSGHADDARDTRTAPAGADDAFAAFCDRDGYPSDGDIDVTLRAAFDEGLRFAISQPQVDAAPVDTTPVASMMAALRAIGDKWMSQDGRDELEDWIAAQASPGKSVMQGAAPTAQQERAWFKSWLGSLSGTISVDAVEFGRRAWAERARRASSRGA